MATHIQTFPEVRHTVYAKTPDGKRRQNTFFQTLNPYNKNKDGVPKTRQEILQELIADGAAWKREIEGTQTTCGGCGEVPQGKAFMICSAYYCEKCAEPE